MLYRFLIFLISPVFFNGVSPKTFLRSYPKSSLLLNIGAGVHRYRDDLINLDIFPYAGVDIVADATALPIPDDTFDAVLCEFLLEHVPDPTKVVEEILRVLKPGGRAYIAIPFVYPFHACPNDFYRWSIEGLRYLLKNATIEDINTRSGPTSALTAQLVTWTAIVLSFGSEALYSVFSTVMLLVFFPLKFLDVIIGRFPTSIHGAADFYAIVKKP
jgi:SAM-dependent methyltransferase